MAECIEEGTLRAYADDALTPEQEAAISIHLAQCERCSRNLAELNALASEVSSLVIDRSYVPEPRVALAQLRGMIPAADVHRAADVSPPSFVAFTGETPTRRASSRPMRLQPVAMGIGLGASMVVVLLLLFAVSGLRNPASKPASEFVPRGMVREMTISHTVGITGEPVSPFTETVWLANGNNHLLMYSTYLSERNGNSTWVEEEAVYSRQLYPYGENIIRKFPYDARHLELYVPNEVNYLMTIPNARILGDSTLDGRLVTIIEAIADKQNLVPNPNVPYDTATDIKLWVDKETSQVLQRQHTTTFLSGERQGTVEVNTMKVIKNELKDASQIAPDFFKFKLPYNATVVEAESPFGATPTPGVAQSGWYEFISDKGGFAVLMPHTPEEQGYSSGMHMTGAREPSVTYIVSYIDHPEDTAQKPDPDEWLDDASYRVLLEVDGKVLSEKPIALRQYPGREIMLERADGRYTRSRLYSVGSRLYNVYAITSEDQLTSEDVEKYLNSFKLSGGVSDFVPKGMVRHLVVSDTTTSSDPNANTENSEPNTHKQEIWYANGAEHLLMRSITGEGSADGYFVWVDDDTVYKYDSWGGKIIEKSPHRIEDLGPYAPDPEIITKSLNLPNAQVVGYSTLNGRPVVEIESPYFIERIYIEDRGAALNVGRRLWIDTQENRVLQRQDIIPNTVGQSAGTVVTMTGKVVLDELRPISELPADFFKFKLPEGTTLVDSP